MTKDEALKLALEALETYKGFIDDAHIVEGQWHWIDGLDTASTAIKELLAHPKREWVGLTDDGRKQLRCNFDGIESIQLKTEAKLKGLNHG